MTLSMTMVEIVFCLGICSDLESSRALTTSPPTPPGINRLKNWLIRFSFKIFANETYPIEENKYYIRIDDFSFSNEGEKAIVLVQFAIKSARWFWKKEMKGSVILKGYLKYDTVECVIKTRNLHYELKTNSWMLELVDQFYHHEII